MIKRASVKWWQRNRAAKNTSVQTRICFVFSFDVQGIGAFQFLVFDLFFHFRFNFQEFNGLVNLMNLQLFLLTVQYLI